MQLFLISAENGQEILMFNGYIYIFAMTRLFYILCIIVINFVSIVLFIKDLSKKCNVEINPLHPDNCGGLSSIGTLGYISSLPMLIVGVNIVTVLIIDVIYHNIEIFTFYHITIVTIYLLASVAFFFLPFLFLKAHAGKRMKF